MASYDEGEIVLVRNPLLFPSARFSAELAAGLQALLDNPDD
jgi:hypothetical protein